MGDLENQFWAFMTCCGFPLLAAATAFFAFRALMVVRKGKAEIATIHQVATKPRLILPNGEAVLLEVGKVTIVGSSSSADIVISGLEPKHAEISTYQGATVTTWRVRLLAGQMFRTRLLPGVPTTVDRKRFGGFPLKFQDKDVLEFVSGSGTHAVTTKVTARIP